MSGPYDGYYWSREEGREDAERYECPDKERYSTDPYYRWGFDEEKERQYEEWRKRREDDC